MFSAASEIQVFMKLYAVLEIPGGIIPPEDAPTLRAAGVAAVYTPKDYDLTAILADIVEIVARGTREAA